MDSNGKLKQELGIFEAMYSYLKKKQPIHEEKYKTMIYQCNVIERLSSDYGHLRKKVEELKYTPMTEEEKKLKEMLNTFWQKFQDLKNKMPLNEEQKKQRDELFDVYLEEIIKLDPGQWHLREIFVELINLPEGVYV